MEEINKIKKLISNNETGKAISFALSLINSDSNHELILLSARYKKLEEEIRRRIINKEEEQLEFNRINNDLLLTLENQKDDISKNGNPIFEIELWQEEGIPKFKTISNHLILHEFPNINSRIIDKLNFEPEETILFNLFRTKVINIGQVRLKNKFLIEGISFGKINYLSKEVYYNSLHPKVKIEINAGESIEHLVYRAEGESLIRVDGNVIQTYLPYQELSSKKEQILESWIQILDKKSVKPIGWVYIDEKLLIEYEREF